MEKITTDFIINNRKLPIHLGDKSWLMRQPTIEERLDAQSAHEVAYNKFMENERLHDGLDKADPIILRQAAKRGLIAEVGYMLPILLQDKNGKDLFDVYDLVSMEEYDKSEPADVEAWNNAYFEINFFTDDEVKKK